MAFECCLPVISLILLSAQGSNAFEPKTLAQVQLDFDAFHHGPASLGEKQFYTSSTSDSPHMMVNLRENNSYHNQKQHNSKLGDLMYGLKTNTVPHRDEDLTQFDIRLQNKINKEKYKPNKLNLRKKRFIFKEEPCDKDGENFPIKLCSSNDKEQTVKLQIDFGKDDVSACEAKTKADGRTYLKLLLGPGYDKSKYLGTIGKLVGLTLDSLTALGSDKHASSSVDILVKSEISDTSNECKCNCIPSKVTTPKQCECEITSEKTTDYPSTTQTTPKLCNNEITIEPQTVNPYKCQATPKPCKSEITTELPNVNPCEIKTTPKPCESETTSTESPLVDPCKSQTTPIPCESKATTTESPTVNPYKCQTTPKPCESEITTELTTVIPCEIKTTAKLCESEITTEPQTVNPYQCQTTPKPCESEITTELPTVNPCESKTTPKPCMYETTTTESLLVDPCKCQTTPKSCGNEKTTEPPTVAPYKCQATPKPCEWVSKMETSTVKLTTTPKPCVSELTTEPPTIEPCECLTTSKPCEYQIATVTPNINPQTTLKPCESEMTTEPPAVDPCKCQTTSKPCNSEIPTEPPTVKPQTTQNSCESEITTKVPTIDPCECQLSTLAPTTPKPVPYPCNCPQVSTSPKPSKCDIINDPLKVFNCKDNSYGLGPNLALPFEKTYSPAYIQSFITAEIPEKGSTDIKTLISLSICPSGHELLTKKDYAEDISLVETINPYYDDKLDKIIYKESLVPIDELESGEDSLVVVFVPTFDSGTFVFKELLLPVSDLGCDNPRYINDILREPKDIKLMPLSSLHRKIPKTMHEKCLIDSESNNIVKVHEPAVKFVSALVPIRASDGVKYLKERFILASSLRTDNPVYVKTRVYARKNHGYITKLLPIVTPKKDSILSNWFKPNFNLNFPMPINNPHSTYNPETEKTECKPLNIQNVRLPFI